MDEVVIAVFVFVYAGMMLGRIPRLALDRTGIALLGAIVLIALGKIRPGDAWQSIDVSTIALLPGLMVISAQSRMSRPGFVGELFIRENRVMTSRRRSSPKAEAGAV
jgi:Na+/H+ antiporter NhaD/arsenite permease-like protein